MEQIKYIPKTNFNRIVIDTSTRYDEDSSLGTKIFLNGEELKGVRNLKYEVGIDNAPIVTIEMYADVEAVADKENVREIIEHDERN